MYFRTNKPYSEFYQLLDSLARKCNVRGPYAVVKRVAQRTVHQISGQAVSRFFYGAAYPKANFIGAFTEAFDLTLEEREPD